MLSDFYTGVIMMCIPFADYPSWVNIIAPDFQRYLKNATIFLCLFLYRITNRHTVPNTKVYFAFVKKKKLSACFQQFSTNSLKFLIWPVRHCTVRSARCNLSFLICCFTSTQVKTQRPLCGVIKWLMEYLM